MTLPDGAQFEGRFINDHMVAIELSLFDAVYERPLNYPEPVGEPGAPFADPNFKLVVMDALMNTGALRLGPRDRLAKHLLGANFDEEKDGYELLKAVYDYLVRYPLDVAQLAGVEELTFDGGNGIYAYAFPLWDGETDVFDVRSLEGIAQLTALRKLHVISMLRDTDLSRLTPLKALELIGLDHARYRNVRALLDLPALRVLSCGDGSLPDPSLVAELRARKVTVQILE